MIEHDSDKMLKDLFEAIELICEKESMSKKEVPAETLTGFIACPICESSLFYRISSYNGHIHGRCSKVGCLSWME